MVQSVGRTGTWHMAQHDAAIAADMEQQSRTAASSPLHAGPLERRRCPLWHCGLKSSIFQGCKALLGHIQLVVLQTLQTSTRMPVMCSRSGDATCSHTFDGRSAARSSQQHTSFEPCP